MTTAQQLIEQGRAQIVLRLLTLRFGGLTPAARDRVASASVSELDRIAERLLHARSLEEALEP